MKYQTAVGVFILATVLGASAQTAEKPRVYIADSQSWAVSGRAGGNSTAFAATFDGGARPQTAEIIKTFSKKCEACTVTMNRERADFFFIIDHEGGKGYLRKDTKYALFSREGDLIGSDSTRSIGGAVEAACKTIVEHAQK